MTAPDPRVQKALDQIKIENDLEGAMALASEEMKIQDYLQDKSQDFIEGFVVGRQMLINVVLKGTESLKAKWEAFYRQFPEYSAEEIAKGGRDGTNSI